MFGKIGAMRFNHNNINIESQLLSAFYETVTESPKWLEKIGATAFSCSNNNSNWHLSSCFYEIETESRKWLKNSVPQHLVASTLIQNDTCHVVFMKLNLDQPNA